MTDSRDGDVGHASTSPPSRTSHSRRRRLSAPAIAVDDLDHRPVLASQHPLQRRAASAAGCHVRRLERRDRPRARSRSPTRARPLRDGTTVRSDGPIAGRPIGRSSGAERSVNQPAAPAWIGIGRPASGRGGRNPAGRTSAGRPGRPARAPPGCVTKASWDSVSDRRGSASRVTVTRISRRGGAGPEDHDECRTGGGAEDQSKGQEGQLTRGHAGFDVLDVRPPPGVPSPWRA